MIVDRHERGTKGEYGHLVPLSVDEVSIGGVRTVMTGSSLSQSLEVTQNVSVSTFRRPVPKLGVQDTG